MTDVFQRLKKAQARNSPEAVVALLHALLLCQPETTFIGLTEDASVGEAEDFPSGWNENPALFTFQYRLAGVKLIVKFLRIGNNLIVSTLYGEELATLELKCSDFIVASPNFAQLEEVFNKPAALMELFHSHILDKLLPKTAVQEPAAVSAAANIPKRDDPGFFAEPYSLIPSDPLQIGPRMRPRPNPYGDTMPPGFQPFPGYDPMGLEPFGGMQIGPNHPDFLMPGRDLSPHRPGQPPRGARFDPTGPPLPRGMGPTIPAWTGDPDPDEFRPSRGFGRDAAYDNMFL